MERCEHASQRPLQGWGRTLNKQQQDASAVAYADDGYMKAKLSVALEILSDFKLSCVEGGP